MEQVFISYAREDNIVAERLYMDLRRNEIDAWLDTKCLLPGQNWRREISKVIRNCKYFILLTSKHSLNKRGFVQKEMRIAFEILSEVPSNQIFLIPVKLDDAIPYEEEIQNLNWVDFTNSYSKGLGRILSVMSNLEKIPLEFRDPLLPIGFRAPIEFTPFKNYSDFIRDFFNKLPESVHFFDQEHQIYFTVSTTYEGVEIPEYLLDKYPETITIILQHRYLNLNIQVNFFKITVSFNSKWETLVIPYESVLEIYSPTIGFHIRKI